MRHYLGPHSLPDCNDGTDTAVEALLVPRVSLDRMCRLAATAVGASVALVIRWDGLKHYLCGKAGLTSEQAMRLAVICARRQVAAKSLAFGHFSDDGSLIDDPLVTAPPHIRSYACISISSGADHLGQLWLVDSRARQWNRAQQRVAADVAHVIAEQSQLNRARHEAWRELGELENVRQGLKSANNHLWQRQAMLQQTERMAGIGGWELDVATGTVFWNQQVYAIAGRPNSSHALTIPDMISLFAAVEAERVAAALDAAISSGAPFDFEIEMLRSEDRRAWVRLMGEGQRVDGRVERVFGTIQDVTNLREHSRRLWSAANTDSLTGIANRRQFMEYGFRTFRSARTPAVILIDVDDFKITNDTFGHDAGDMVLKEIAKRLKACVADAGLVARLGGDEFGIILNEVTGIDALSHMLNALVEAIREAVPFGGAILQPRVSVGGAQMSPDSRSFQDGLKNADLAVYQAKGLGRDNAVLFDASLRRRSEEKLMAAASVHRALATDDVIPFYQPQVCLASGDIVGLESLLRWRDPALGLRAPADVCGIFEDRDLAIRIGDRMLDEVVRNAAGWLMTGVCLRSVSLNLTRQQLLSPGFTDRVVNRLREFDLPAGFIRFEIQEALLAGAGSRRIFAVLEGLRKAGVGVVLDNFGTGVGSIVTLRTASVDCIKIKSPRLEQVRGEPDTNAFANALFMAAKGLNLKTLAEGVETIESAAVLAAAGWDEAQGFAFGKPMIGSRVPFALGRWQSASSGAGRIKYLNCINS